MSVAKVQESIETVNSTEPIENSKSDVIEEKRKYLLTDENFQRIKDVQREIFEKTEISPSLRKLVNSLITKEEIENLKQKLICQFDE